MADEFDLKPTSRGEEFLDVILRSLGGDTPDIPQPAWRYEEYLAAIANAIQNGGGGSSGGGVFEISVDGDTGAFNKTWQEIHDAMMSGKLCILVDLVDGVNVGAHMVTDAYMEAPPGSGNIEYNVATVNSFATTDSANGYPVM